MRSALLLWILAGVAGALEPSPQSAGLFFDAQGERQFTQLTPYQIRTLYLVAFDFPQLSAWEAQLGFDDPGFTVLATRLAPPGASNAGSVANWFVSLGACIEIEAQRVLLELDFAWWRADAVPARSVVCLAPAMPTSVFPPWPAHRDCAGAAMRIDFDARHPLQLFEACAGINFPRLVDAARSSVGVLKARF